MIEEKVKFTPEALSNAMKMRSIFADSLRHENRRINQMLEQAFRPYLSMMRKFIDRDDAVLEAYIEVGDRYKLIPPSRMNKWRDSEPWAHIEFRWIPMGEYGDDEPVDFGDTKMRVKRLCKKFSEEIALPVYVKED